MPKIFCLGFNKSGTTTLHKFFTLNGISSLHLRRDKSDLKLGMRMHRNLITARPIMHGVEEFTAYSDMSYCDNIVQIDACRYFRQIHAEYPDAYFILNVRPVDRWLASRMNHRGGDLAARAASAYGCSVDDLAAIWRGQFQGHVRECDDYFARNDARYLKFDIEANAPQSLSGFLADDFDVDPDNWGHENRS